MDYRKLLNALWSTDDTPEYMKRQKMLSGFAWTLYKALAELRATCEDGSDEADIVDDMLCSFHLSNIELCKTIHELETRVSELERMLFGEDSSRGEGGRK